jgi:hypothetical protein
MLSPWSENSLASAFATEEYIGLVPVLEPQKMAMFFIKKFCPKVKDYYGNDSSFDFKKYPDFLTIFSKIKSVIP